MTAIEKMVAAFDEKDAWGEATTTEESIKYALRALIAHIKENGGEEMVRAACIARDGIECSWPTMDCNTNCGAYDGILNGIIAALGRVVEG